MNIFQMEECKKFKNLTITLFEKSECSSSNSVVLLSTLLKIKYTFPKPVK